MRRGKRKQQEKQTHTDTHTLTNKQAIKLINKQRQGMKRHTERERIGIYFLIDL